MKKVWWGVGIVVVLVLAFVVVPSLLRARVTSGESPVIGDTRSVISAMSAYQSANGGFHEGRIDCLARPSECIPGWTASQPTFLDPYLAAPSVQKSGYLRTFVAGPPVPPADIAKAKASRTSAQCFAYVAVPASPETGVRSYCGDCSGRICYYRDGRRPPLMPDGSCGSVGPDGKVQPTCETIQ